MYIAVCTPSRGVIYTKTVQSIIEGMKELSRAGIGADFYTSYNLGIPDGHNYCIDTAFQNPSVDKIFFIEEDMYVEPQAFLALATSEEPIVSLQYNDKNGSPHGIIHKNESGEVLWCGLGSTCIKKEVFEKVGRPYFRTDVRYRVVKKQTPNGPVVTDYQEMEARSQWQYGGLDVDFYTRARKFGYKICILPQFKAYHFHLQKLGEPYVNNGCHDIREV